MPQDALGMAGVGSVGVRSLFASLKAQGIAGNSLLGRGFCCEMVDSVVGAAGCISWMPPFVCSNLSSPSIRYVIETTRLSICLAGSRQNDERTAYGFDAVPWEQNHGIERGRTYVNRRANEMRKPSRCYEMQSERKAKGIQKSIAVGSR